MAKKQGALVDSNIPGLIFNKQKTAYSFSPHQLPASEHFFRSNTYMVTVGGGEIHFLFGQKSLFDKEQKNLKAAVEISMPIQMAAIFLYETIHTLPSLSGDRTFFSILEDYIKAHPTSEKFECELGLPSDTNLYRAFSTNYSMVAMSNGQAMLEFFEANPALIAHLSHGKPVRSHDGLKPVIAIILPPAMMRELFEKTKGLLEPHKRQPKEESYELES
jgi:hypothetical protein